MSAPCQSICTPWAGIADVCAPCDAYDFDALLLEDSLLAASEILFQLSGRQFPGSCQDTVRPTGQWGQVRWGRWWDWRQLMSSTDWWNRGGFCGCAGREVGCGWLPEIDLGALPITSIVEIKIDGVVVDPATYRVDEYRWLVRTTPDAETPNQGWPCCQRLDLPSTEDDTFEITYTYGTLPPSSGVRAAATLGCQLALACTPGATDCQLPQRVTNVVRQGVSITLLDPQDFLDSGRTGLYVVDLFLKSVNPSRLTRPATVLTPTMRGETRRAGT